MLHQHASHVARQRPRKSSGRRPTNIGCTRTAALPVLATILHNTVLYVMSHVGKNNHTDTMPYITNNTTIYVGWPIWALPDTLSGQFYGLSCQTQWLDINQCGLCLKSWWKFWCWGEGVEKWIWSWYGAFLPTTTDDILCIHWIHCIHYNVPTCCLNPMVIWTENYIRRMLILTPTTGVLGGGLAAASKAIGYKSMHWWGTTDHNFNWWSRPDLPIANTCIKIS